MNKANRAIAALCAALTLSIATVAGAMPAQAQAAYGTSLTA
jgi:hypothetical protein